MDQKTWGGGGGGGERENAGHQCFLKPSFPESLKSYKGPTKKVFIYKIQVNPIHTILKDGIFYNFMHR